MEYGRTLVTGGLRAGILLSALVASASGFAGERLAPDFSLPAISDRDATITLSAYRGKTVYLDFWSSWCAPCRESLPLLSKLHQEFSGDDFQIVGVNLDALPADGRRIVEQYAIEYPVASDITGIAAQQFGASTLPAAFVINGDGVIQPELPQMDKQNISAIKASLLELIEQERQTRPLVN
ncbi:MAG: TlpA family protein disulfide reductase [Gammaproteobacteria bacterium]|nr:TlpA family protein disulfide reductase [Gammaproteobacteria bacterium]